MKKTKRIKKQFWLSEAEAKELKHKADMCGLSETAVIRILIKGYEPREKSDSRFYEMMREMYAIGNNLNQISRKAHSLGFIDTPYLRQELERLAQFQLKVEQTYLLPEKSNLVWKER